MARAGRPRHGQDAPRAGAHDARAQARIRHTYVGGARLRRGAGPRCDPRLAGRSYRRVAGSQCVRAASRDRSCDGVRRGCDGRRAFCRGHPGGAAARPRDVRGDGQRDPQRRTPARARERGQTRGRAAAVGGRRGGRALGDARRAGRRTCVDRRGARVAAAPRVHVAPRGRPLRRPAARHRHRHVRPAPAGGARCAGTRPLVSHCESERRRGMRRARRKAIRCSSPSCCAAAPTGPRFRPPSRASCTAASIACRLPTRPPCRPQP